LRIITYEASNSKLKVRNLVVTLSAENDSVISIVGTVETKNLLSDSEQHLRYESGKGYLISGKEKILFLKEKIYEIEVEY
ncbi:MAG: hypothetical protein IIA45_00610, partial [Bacteroidetes bacterium]|nr:hypothetical protein [Bacteroidota bacterium]